MLSPSVIDLSVVKVYQAKVPDNGYINVDVSVAASAKLGEVDFSGATVGTSAVSIEVAGTHGVA